MGVPSKYVEQLCCHDFNLKHISLYDKPYTDLELRELFDCLLDYPNVVSSIYLISSIEVTDETGVKIARCLAGSSTIVDLVLRDNEVGLETYLAIAAALRTNTSLTGLYVFRNRPVYQTRVDNEFIDALRINPVRPVESNWQLYSGAWFNSSLHRLSAYAEKSTPPSMLEFLLYVHLETEINKSKIY